MGFFKKLTSSTSNFFKKAGGQVDNMFHKTSDAVAKAADATGGALKQGGNIIGGVVKQVGNTLEKAAPIAADVGAGLAVLAGQPELAPVFVGAGQAAQRLGSQTKRAGLDTQQAGRNANNMLQQKGSAFQGTIEQARTQVANTNSQIQQRLTDAGNAGSNALAQIHSDLVTQ